jgi:ectoine hydroxylase-related dioxygenase (phytanoyl-CoA dioxygenase family)
MLIERFATDGFVSIPGVLSVQECASLAKSATAQVARGPGSRCLLSHAWCTSLVARLRLHPSLSSLLREAVVPVQCTYFTKSASGNWAVSPHQDLSIPVAERVSHPELKGWSVKEGALFVQAPTALLERLVAVRVHLDPCMHDDGPLHVVPGSHRGGVVHSTAVGNACLGSVACVAEPGTALALRPLLMHSSPRASGTSLRRVLHFLFGPAELPHGLSWHTAV